MEKTEIWQTPLEYDNYEISNTGAVRNKTTKQILNGQCQQSGISVNLTDNSKKKKKFIVHYLVAQLYIKNPNNFKYVKHCDCNNKNNNCENLMWVKQLSQNRQIINIIDEKIIDEEWKTVSENINYEISNKGRVRNIYTKDQLKPRSVNGYTLVTLHKPTNNVLVHRLVAKEFIPNIENKHSVDHFDKNRSNNNVENLRWATSKEQCENRNHTKKKEKNRKIWRIDLINNEKKESYDNINYAIKWLIDNKLFSGKFSSIKIRLWCVLRNPTLTAYGYKWEYEKIENLENEIWKNVNEIIPNSDKYQISNMGRLKNPHGSLAEGTKDGSGYIIVFIGTKERHKMHRLVALAFIPNPENKRCVNHRDGIKKNNCLDNLEWATHQENNQHAMDTNLNGCSKPIYVLDINTNIKQKFANKNTLIKNFKMSRSTINKYVDTNIPFKNFLLTMV